MIKGLETISQTHNVSHAVHRVGEKCVPRAAAPARAARPTSCTKEPGEPETVFDLSCLGAADLSLLSTALYVKIKYEHVRIAVQ